MQELVLTVMHHAIHVMPLVTEVAHSAQLDLLKLMELGHVLQWQIVILHQLDNGIMLEHVHIVTLFVPHVMEVPILIVLLVIMDTTFPQDNVWNVTKPVSHVLEEQTLTAPPVNQMFLVLLVPHVLYAPQDAIHVQMLLHAQDVPQTLITLELMVPQIASLVDLNV
jgi:cellobiose-specific phosphotransferase system component IIA